MSLSKTASLLVVVMASMAAGLGGCASGGAVSIQPGYFFGHDLRHEQSIVYVLDLSGSMRGNRIRSVRRSLISLAGGHGKISSSGFAVFRERRK